MPKATSAQKAARKAERKRIRNRASLRAVRSYISKAERLVVEKELSAAEEAVHQAISALDRIAQRGVIHPNNIARRKSRLVREFNAVFKAAPQPLQSTPGSN